jgi:hypothetical protein
MPELPREFDLHEKTTGLLTGTLVGNDHVTPIPLASLSTLILTLYAIIADSSMTIINARDHQNVLNANNVTVHATTGLLTWTIQVLDTTLVEPTLPFERHIALFEWTTASGAAGKAEIILVVKNLAQV